MKTLYKLFNTLALTAIAVVASAQTLSVQGIEAKTGEQKMLTVSLSGAASATALQFNLSLPANMTINEGGCALGNAATNHTLSVNKMNNGDYLFVMYSLDFTALVDGTLLTIPVTIGNDAKTGNGNLNTIRSSGEDVVSHQHESKSFTISVKEVKKGDVNGDGEVNVGDIMAVINYMAGQTENIDKKVGDVNNDGNVNVGDIMAIINIMAGNPTI